MINLAGKTALVTGGARGIGRACAVRLAQAGANVVVNFLSSKEDAATTVRELQQLGVNASAVQADVSEHEDVQAMVDYVQERFGRLDIIVSNAAAGGFRPLAEVTPANLESILRTNASPMLWLAQAAAQSLTAHGQGKVVGISSHGSIRAFANYGAIGTSKAALEALCRHLAFEFGPQGINFNVVLSGMVETKAIQSMPGSAGLLQASQDLMLTRKRLLSAEQIADAVLFLASPLSDQIQGQTIIVDGGVSLRV